MHEVENTLPGGYLKRAEAPPPGTFDIGLVSAGAVSGGAFSAGVMDFLIEALDAFEAEKSRQRELHGDDPLTWDIPGHQVRIRVMASASAGSIVGAISAVALKYRIPPVRHDTANPQANPLYRTWVSEIDITRLLDTRDFATHPDKIASFLDSTVLAELAQQAIDFQGEPAPARDWLHNPVRFIFTQNNLRGIPYSAAMTGNRERPHRMLAHADYVSYAVRYADTDGTPVRLDERVLSFPNRFSDDLWKALAFSALGSGAFPAFLTPRIEQRPVTDYGYRFALIPDDQSSQLEIATLKPDWNGQSFDTYSAVVVDGGTMNNEPLELARTELAGIAGRNPRAGHLADRAVILIDPFPDDAPNPFDAKKDLKDSLFSSLTGLLGAWKDQSRFSAAAMALADSDAVYSRFMITPNRERSAESKYFDLASSSLGSFGGFLSETFRRHDYLLGRRNCQQFLRQHFGVPITNAKLTSRINPALLHEGNPLMVKNRAGELEIPLIPLIGKLSEPEPLPQWPTQTYDPETLREPLTQRLKGLESALIGMDYFSHHPVKKAELWVAWRILNGHLIDLALDLVRKDLKERNLVQPAPQ